MPAFAGVVSFFESGGWRTGENLFAMPYDWRYPGTGSAANFPFLKELVENASATNGGRRVVLWAVSGGPQWALSFLHRMPQAWKDRYLAYFVAQSPLWSGVAASVPAVVNGLSVPQAGGALPAKFLKGFSRAVPSVLWLFPRAGVNAGATWTQKDTIISTPSKNYSAFDLDELFDDVGGIDELVPVRRFLAADPDLGDLAAPGVNTFVAYGYGLDTAIGAVYKQNIRPGVALDPPTLMVGSGDNTVPLRSSLRARAWQSAPVMEGKRLLYNGYDKMPHAQCWPATSDDPAPCFRDVMDALRAEVVENPVHRAP